MFDDDAMKRSEAAVLEQLPRMIHAANQDGGVGLAVEALFAGNCNDTPVTSDILSRQLLLLRQEGELSIVADDGAESHVPGLLRGLIGLCCRSNGRSSAGSAGDGQPAAFQPRRSRGGPRRAVRCRHRAPAAPVAHGAPWAAVTGVRDWWKSKGPTLQTYAFLILDLDRNAPWLAGQARFRCVVLPHRRRMAFKAMNDAFRRRALAPISWNWPII